jgi:probable rRNA maturation factor
VREHVRGGIGVWICSDPEIAELHRQFMDVEGPTDVLSFPGDLGYLGDIAVSYETAARQAADEGHSFEREVAYLTLHGLLHLLGYDDLDLESRARMFEQQDRLFVDFERERAGGWR